MKTKSPTVLVAGATGYLGGYVVRELMRENRSFRALARSSQKLSALGVDADAIDVREVTSAESLAGCCEGIDVVISTIGITRQRNGLTYMDVDYRANKNLLEEAKRAGVKKFIYVSALRGDELRHLKIFEAKERFIDELKQSGLRYTVLRPNGFFSDMGDFLEMARRGRVFLFGNGHRKLNPIHGEDLAHVCIDAIGSEAEEIKVGGPEVLSHDEIASMALKANGQPGRVWHLPDVLRRLTITALRWFTPVRVYGPLEFFLTTMEADYVAPTHGTYRLADFFNSRTKAALAR